MSAPFTRPPRLVQRIDQFESFSGDLVVRRGRKMPVRRKIGYVGGRNDSVGAHEGDALLFQRAFEELK